MNFWKYIIIGYYACVIIKNSYFFWKINFKLKMNVEACASSPQQQQLSKSNFCFRLIQRRSICREEWNLKNRLYIPACTYIANLCKAKWALTIIIIIYVSRVCRKLCNNTPISRAPLFNWKYCVVGTHTHTHTYKRHARAMTWPLSIISFHSRA